MNKIKILLFDIETSPHLSWHWGLYDQNISPIQVVQRSRTLCFAAKFHKKKVQFFAEWEQGHQEMIQAVFDLLDEADIVVAYNGDSFDVKKVNAEFARYKMGRPSPYRTVDLLKVARRNFSFFNNKFDSVLSELSLTSKVKNRGMQLWIDVMGGDEKAQREMKKYCIGDVHPSLEELYDELLPWIDNHPHVGLYIDEQDACPRCGGLDLEKRGFYYTGVSKFQQRKCRSCGGWSHDSRRLSTVSTRGSR